MKNAKGVSLFEVLMSLILLSVIMMSFYASQRLVQKQEHAMHYLNQARLRLQNMIEIFHQTSDPPESIITLWQKQIADSLPQGNGKIESVNHHKVITITWGLPPYSCRTLTRCLQYGFT